MSALNTAFDLLQQRANLVVESRKILDATLGAGKDMAGEDKAKWEGYQTDISKLTERAKILQQQEKMEADLRARSDEPVRPALPGAATTMEPAQRGKETPAWRKGVLDFYRRSADSTGGIMRISEARHQLPPEQRALQVDLATAGGYLIHPEHLSDLIRALDNVVYVRSKARKIRLTTGDSVDLPTLAGKPTSFAWGTELSKPTADTAMKYGRRTLKTNPARGLITVSRKMLRLADPPADESVKFEFAQLFGQQEENVFFNGTGAGQPQGLMVASANGLDTTRDYSTGNTTTKVKFDGIIGAIGNLKLQYRAMAEFFFARTVMTQIRQEKDSQGRYLWSNSVAPGQPDTIYGYPCNETEYITVTPGANEYPGLFGNLEQYMIADGTDLEVQVLDEVFWATDEVGYKFSVELDANVRDVAAWTRIQYAAS